MNAVALAHGFAGAEGKPMVQKRCRHCGEPFEADPRAARVQKYCKAKECQQARQRKKYQRWNNVGGI
jgi:hypothetical protein